MSNDHDHIGWFVNQDDPDHPLSTPFVYGLEARQRRARIELIGNLAIGVFLLFSLAFLFGSHHVPWLPVAVNLLALAGLFVAVFRAGVSYGHVKMLEALSRSHVQVRVEQLPLDDEESQG